MRCESLGAQVHKPQRMITASKRLQKEHSQIKKSTGSKDEILKLEPNSDNIMRWNATIQAPKDSYYEGFSFDLLIDVPSNYPLVPPVIKFKTKIFHPNVLFDVRFSSPALSLSHLA